MGNNKLCAGLNDAAKTIHEDNKRKGFWDNKRETGTLLMLCVSELAEALEADRKNKKAQLNKFVGFSNMGFDKDYNTYLNEDAIPSFETNIKDTFEDEIADTVIRILDLCGAMEIDIERHINLKLKYNRSRERMHGKAY